MRILASNPDTIGDMVLRQPLYRALIGGGHELTLIVRKSVERIARLIAPEARILLLPAEVYGPVDERWDDFASLIAEARDTSPDLLLIAPYQWTRFEERLAAALRDLPGLQVVGMTGRLYGGDPFAGASPKSELKFDRALAVDEDVPEADKNALLADMLGCPVASVEPVLSPDEPSLAAARAVLADRGLSPGDYWIACVTGTANVSIKAWPPQQWAATLKTWHERFGRRFLFVGLPAERSVVDLVIAGMGDAAATSAVWMEEDGDIATLAALAAMSSGYVGHDTGPMHIAAAVGKPVLAIFGGGHKLRFVPRVSPSVVLSVRVPCAGCGWACSFDKAWCVAALRPVDVLRAAEDLEVGRILAQDIRLLPLPVDTHNHMTACAADLARDRLRLLAAAQRQLDSVDPRLIANLTLERNSHAQNADELSRQLSIVSGEVQRLQAVTQSLQTETGVLSQQLQDREQAVVELRRAVDDANQRTTIEAAARKAEVEPLRKEVEQLRHKLTAMEAPQPAAIVPARPRRTWRELFVDVVCGKRHYEPKNPPRSMPKICLVTVVRAGDRAEDVKRTIESVLGERYPHLDYALVDATSISRDPKGSAVTRDDVTANDAPQTTPVSERTREDPDSAEESVSKKRADADGMGMYSCPCPAPNEHGHEYMPMPSLPNLLEQITQHSDIRVVPATVSPFAAVAETFANSDADLVAWLDVGCGYEPGALHRIGEYFRDHSMAMAAVQEETAGAGWRFGAGWPGVDVDSLRAAESCRGLPHVVFRREPYNLLGQINPARGEAAGWDLLIRFSRRFGIRRVTGHGVWRFAAEGIAGETSPADSQDLQSAKTSFDATYGLPGRAKTATLRLTSALLTCLRGRRESRWRRFDVRGPLGPDDRTDSQPRRGLSPRVAPETEGQDSRGNQTEELHESDDLQLPRDPGAQPPARSDAASRGSDAQSVSVVLNPVTRRRPQRLLLTAPDPTTTLPNLHRVYVDVAGDAAIAAPPITPERLRSHRDQRAASAGGAPGLHATAGNLHGHEYMPMPPKSSAVPDGAVSAHQRFGAGPVWARVIASLPCPYWRIAGATAGRESAADRLLSLVGPAVALDSAIRALVIAGTDSLDSLKSRTTWTLTALETDVATADTAEAAGHRVVRCDPQDAFMTLPDGEVFDLIFLPSTLEHWDDPVWMLRRLTRLLTPTGRIVVRTPNLDSMLLRRFGPTWWFWQPPYHRIIFGRRGLRLMAEAADLRIERLKTTTDAHSAAASVQLNQLGLAGVVPDGATFEKRIARRGAKWAGWARLLWDRWGRGDEMWAVFRAV